MIKKLFNPFTFIAGGYSLIIGIIIILLTSIIGFFSNIHFPDVISVKTSSDYPLQYHIIQNVMNFIIVSTIMYMVSIIFSKSKIRIVDVYGTQALARFPYLIAAFIGFSNSMDNFKNYVFWQFLKQGDPIDISTSDILITIILVIITLLLTIWLIVLMYNAFKISANLKGPKSIFLFIGGLIISIFISSLFTIQLIKFF